MLNLHTEAVCHLVTILLKIEIHILCTLELYETNINHTSGGDITLLTYYMIFK